MTRQQVVISASLGLAFYLLLDLVEPYIALPLRQISSTIAGLILNALSIQVVQTGTILSTEKFTFDVEAACSGSTTLRVLLSVGVVWCGVHPFLTLFRRLVAVALVVPIALLANGIRVAILVGVGDALMTPIEGIPHVLIGLLGFIIAMSGLYLVTSLLATHDQVKTDPRFPLQIGLLIALLILYTPVFLWIADRLTLQPTEAVGLVWVLVGLAFLVPLLRQPAIGGTTKPAAALALFGFAAVLITFASIIDINSLAAWAMLLGVAAVIAMFRGWPVAFAAAPLLALIALGFPMVNALIGMGTRAMLGIETSLLTWILRAVAGVILLGFHWKLRPTAVREDDKALPSSATEAATKSPLQLARPSPVTSNGLAVALLCALLAVAGQAYLGQTGAALEAQTLPEIPYLIGDWVGRDNVLLPIEIEAIGSSRILSRRYWRGDDEIHLILTSTGADRRRAHSPEWCMTGTGWRVLETTEVELPIPGRATLPVTLCLMERDGRQIHFYYWFSNGREVMSSHRSTMREDLRARLAGSINSWLLVRLVLPKDAPPPLEMIQLLSEANQENNNGSDQQ